MTTIIPAPPHSEVELRQLYPQNLALQQVQVFFRHGERTPVTNSFQHLGLSPYWPLCEVTGKFRSALLVDGLNGSWESIPWKRRLEAIRPDDGPMTPTSINGQADNICNVGELTDKGRMSMLALGERIRRLYVDQLGFMPRKIGTGDSIYLRASPFSRALESTHQMFLGMYPQRFRQHGYLPKIVQRFTRDENLLPNEEYCTRFIQMMKEYSHRTANRWNESSDMDKLNSLLSKYMPTMQRIAVNSKPGIHSIYDVVNSTLAADSPAIKLPLEFYDEGAREILDRIAVEEEFGPYSENEEYRTLGIGALLGDIVERMTQRVEGGKDSVKFTLSGGHDSTIMGLLGSLGAFNDRAEPWPPYSSHVAIELFGDEDRGHRSPSDTKEHTNRVGISRTKTESLTVEQKQRLDGYYVRVRYNERVVSIPGCKPRGRHLHGNESFCTLATFKEICDKITPRDIRGACMKNLDKPSIPDRIQPAGYY